MNFIIKSFLVLFLFSILLSTACNDKGGGTTPPTPGEENLVISIEPDPGTTVVKALGTTYDFRVNITSKIPTQGVTITVTFKRDSDNTTLFSQTLQSTTTPVNITISNITQNEVGTVTVTVTSKSKSSNTATKSFKLTRK